MKTMNMKESVKKLLVTGIISTMLITPAGAFAATTDEVPEAPEAPIAESYEDNDKIADYNRKVDEYNAAAENYNKAVDEEHDRAVEETNRKNEEIAAYNEAEEKRVSEAKARNEQAAKDAEERNRQIDEENAAGRKAAEEARDAKYESDLAKYNEDVEQYKAKAAQYESDLKMEQRIKNAGYQSVEQYNNMINTHYNEPADKSVEKNANAQKLGAADTYSIQEAEVKSGRKIKVTVRHNFYDTDISYTEEFEIDANDIITFKPLCAMAENTNPGYAAFYYNTDENHSMGYWMESDSYVGTNAKYHDSGWECGDTHVISFRDGTVRRNDIEDIEVEYNYAWMALRKYATYNVPTAPDTPEAPVKGEIDFEDAPYVDAVLEDIIDADILDFLESPEKKAYLDFLTHMDLFDIPPMPEADPADVDTPETPAAPEAPEAPETSNTTDSTAATSVNAKAAAPAAAPAIMTGTNTQTVNAAAAINNGEAPLAANEGTADTAVIDDGQAPRTNSVSAWALINLIAAIITVVISAVTVIFGLRKKEDDEDEEKEEDRTNRKIFVRGLGVAAAVISVIVFILTEDMSLPMQMTDDWTLLMIVILAVEAVIAAASKKTTREGEEKQAEAELA